MKKQLKQLTLILSIIFVVFFIVFIINQTAAVVELANNLNPIVGKIVFYALILIFTFLFIIPIIIYFRMPPAIRIPDSDDPKEIELYITRLRSRLKKNSNLSQESNSLENKTDIENALKVLDDKANELIKASSHTVFLTTAISQNGRLDAFVVLIAQTRLIWNIAHIYNQRPSLRELVNLYSNVAVTTFLVSEIEDIDISAHVEPVIRSVLGGAVTGAIPGVNVVAGLVTNSIFEGTANAFLMLRVGIITRKYYSSMSSSSRGVLRRSASIEAASLLGNIVVESSRSVTDAIWQAAKKSAKTLPKTVVEASKRSSEIVLDTSVRSAGVIGDASKKSANTVLNAVKKVFSGKDEKSQNK